ncbi:hypothetical protein M0802_000571 [Mischocyttarus mexicanus]|nr:hypothetical protein M0802_000571 [Mischocyttarus mexicanus]
MGLAIWGKLPPSRLTRTILSDLSSLALSLTLKLRGVLEPLASRVAATVAPAKNFQSRVHVHQATEASPNVVFRTKRQRLAWFKEIR